MAIDEQTDRHAGRASIPEWASAEVGAGSLVLSGPALRLDLIDAQRDPDIAADCYRKKQTCYARFGAAAASVSLSDGISAEDLHLVTATDCDSGAIVASVSVYRRGADKPLPIERAIGHHASMRAEIAGWDGRRIAEMSGLWAEDAWRKTGLSESLLHAAMAACRVLGAEKIVAFGHQHLLGFYETVGLLPDASLGRFSYPDPSYVSTVMRADPLGFLTVPAGKRARVFGFAEGMARGEPIFWRGFDECIAAERGVRA
ncbi:hypothetical protein FCE95_13695 [Luteimonas gilva]|uniref:GNAT family N-acetyltransferase n=1 Tax=Luteimonas gilva TaxID=2572684 RepID=A0A4U5JIQ1_9GAMM|nr:hypothetical protein [Luteimonas gilva]TKR29214.1 hypothetical protein FCE95_13695 [Luteimonas gilva]